MNFEKITKISKKDHKGKVYDLEVANDHSYNINGLVVHNSSGACLVAYLLNITRIDPVEYDFDFARFMTPERADSGKRVKIILSNGEEKIYKEFDRIEVMRNGEQKRIKAKEILDTDEIIA